MKSTSQIILGFILVLLPTSVGLRAQEIGLQEIAYRSLANQDAFKTFACTFSFEAGVTVGRTELVAGQFTELYGTAHGFWAKDEDRETFVVSVGETFVPIPGLTDGINVPFRGGEKIVDNGERRAYFNDALGVAHVGGQSEMSGKNAELNPWYSLGRFGSGESGIPGKSVLANNSLPSPFRNEISLSGSNVTVLSVLGKFSLLHEFSTEKNFLPIHVAVLSDERESHVETVGAIEIEGVGWFPKVVIAYDVDNNTNEFTNCFRLTIDKFEYRTPSVSELTFTAAGDYQLHGPLVIPSEQMAYVAEGASLNPSVLEELSNALTERKGFGVARIESGSPFRIWFFAVNGIVLLAAAFYWVYTKRPNGPG